MASTNMYCSSHCISASSYLTIGYAPQCLTIPPHVQNSYITHAMGCTIRGSNAGRGKWGFLFSKTPRPALGPPQLRIQYVGGVPRNFVRKGGGGSTNSIEDRGQRERGSGGGSP